MHKLQVLQRGLFSSRLFIYYLHSKDSPKFGGFSSMVERRIELDRRYQKKKKMTKLKQKLAMAKDNREKEIIVNKIKVISPWWTEPTK